MNANGQDNANRQAAAIERLTWRLNDIVEATGLSRRTIERERSAGRFPRPDKKVGKMPLWRPETIREWVAEGGGR
jgi:predicted DNA-binding transcriptional regulator AlpA